MQPVIAGPGPRLVAALIDGLLFGITACCAWAAIPLWITERTGDLLVTIFALFAVAYIVYCLLLEGLTGATLGKRAMQIRVVDRNGQQIDMTASAIRNIMRVIDWLPFGNLLGLALIAGTSTRQRLGDRAAGTLVVIALPESRQTVLPAQQPPLSY